MGLFRPIWMTNKRTKDDEAAAAVRKITDQNKLKRIAMEAPRYAAAFAAIEGIDDEELLFEFARFGGLPTKVSWFSIKPAAMRRISRQDLLEKILESIEFDWNPDMKYSHSYAIEVYERLDYPPLDWALRRSDDKSDSKLVALVEKMTYPQDVEALKEVLQNAKSLKAKELVVDRLPYDENKEVYHGIIGREYKLRGHIFEKYPAIKDYYIDIIKDENETRNSRNAAAIIVENEPEAQKYWINLAMDDNVDIYTRMSAAESIKDKSLIPDTQKQRCAEGNHLWVDAGSMRQQYQFGPSSDHRRCIYCGEEYYEYFDGD